GFAEHHTRIVHQVAGGKVVAAVDDHVIVGENLQRVLTGEHGLMRYHGDVRVDVFQRAAGGLSLRAADVVGEVHHLPVQVGQIDTVAVDDAERADAGCGEVDRRRPGRVVCRVLRRISRATDETHR